MSRNMTSREKLVYMGILLSVLTAQVYCQEKKNILFLVADDMRPQIEAWTGPDFPSPVSPKMVTPNLDALAAKSLVLKRAYCQQARCNPSRTSLLTGRRPDTTHVYDLKSYFRKVAGNFTTLPQYFKQQGYYSVGMGKVFHPGMGSGYDDPVSWSAPYFHADRVHWKGKSRSWYAVPSHERVKYPLPDDQIASHAIQTLQELAKKPSEKPFFLAVGFHKPHLPFIFPAEFLSDYPVDQLHPPANPHIPQDFPQIAWANSGELRGYVDIKLLPFKGAFNTSIGTDEAIKLRRAYYSALSYTDYLIGTVIKELEDLDLAKNTIISFWGDHGYLLGEHGMWAKNSTFELTDHAPMMVHVPGLTDEGVVTERLTEFVDLYPSLVEFAGLPSVPRCPRENADNVTLCTEGVSFVPLVKNPNATWKDRTFTQFPRKGVSIMGYSMRTDRYRYTEWINFQHEKAHWDQIYGAELYDHQDDPQENVNLARQSAYQSLRSQLSKMLHEGWHAGVPPSEQTIQDEALYFIPERPTL